MRVVEQSVIALSTGTAATRFLVDSFERRVIQVQIMDIDVTDGSDNVMNAVGGDTHLRSAVRPKPINSAHKKVFSIEARVLTARVHTPTWACLTWPLHEAVTMDLGEMKVFRSRMSLGSATAADFDAVCDAVRLVPCCLCGTTTFGATGGDPVGDEVCVDCGCGNAIDPGALQGLPPIDQKKYDRRLLARINAANQKQSGG